MTVSSVADGPVAVDDAATAVEDTPFSSAISLIANDTDGDGDVDAADDNGAARQQFGPGTLVTRPNPVAPGTIDARFYSVSGYDTGAVRVPGGGTRRELRYALFWSGLGLSTGSADDDPRQLGYTDPPENTVITWNSYFRDYDAAGSVARNKNDIVLFLGGAARPYDAKDVSERSWRVLP